MHGIEEGTEDEVLEKYIGHFKNSEKEKGNVCLMAHNYGSGKNYFESIDTLEEGDLIYYTVNGKTRKYKVYEVLIFYEDDEELFEKTKTNMLSLITEIKNRDKYRLCVQAIEFEE